MRQREFSHQKNNSASTLYNYELEYDQVHYVGITFSSYLLIQGIPGDDSGLNTGN